MKIFVFGKSGQVARALQARADSLDISITCLSRDECDLTNANEVRRVCQSADADLFINAAAFTDVDGAETSRDACRLINEVAPTIMAKEAHSRQIPLIHISSDYVFDGTKAEAWREDDITNPINHYGLTKRNAEQAIRAHCANHIILRTSWVFAETGKNFVNTMLRLAKTHSELRIINDQIGGPTPAISIAETCLTMAAAIYHQPHVCGTYHYSGYPAVSWAGFAEAIFSKLENAPRVIPITSQEFNSVAARPANSVLDCQKLMDVFGLRQPLWQDALAGFIQE